MERQYLFNSTEEFFNSPVWEGDRFYDAKPYRPWFGWIYISLFDHIPVEDYKDGKNAPIKIGRSSDVFRRNLELFSNAGDQKASSIVYVWSVPLSIRFENDLKTLLTAYIMPERTDQTGRSEIVWGIPLIPLISMVQLSILKTCLHMRYIKSDMDLILRPPDTIKEQGKVYPGKHRYMVPHELDIDRTFAQFHLKEPDNPITVKEYIFVQDNRIPATNPVETSKTYDKPEIEVKYLSHSDVAVYAIGTYIYAKYKDKLLYLCKIIGYGETKDQRYAIRWLETSAGKPIRTGDPEEPLRLSDDMWEFVSEDVVPIQRQNGTLYNKLKDIDKVTVGTKAIVKKLRFN